MPRGELKSPKERRTESKVKKKSKVQLFTIRREKIHQRILQTGSQQKEKPSKGHGTKARKRKSSIKKGVTNYTQSCGDAK